MDLVALRKRINSEMMFLCVTEKNLDKTTKRIMSESTAAVKKEALSRKDSAGSGTADEPGSAPKPPDHGSLRVFGGSAPP
jgi:hypothetical protein